MAPLLRFISNKIVGKLSQRPHSQDKQRDEHHKHHAHDNESAFFAPLLMLSLVLTLNMGH